jgi:hypothetical protein
MKRLAMRRLWHPMMSRSWIKLTAKDEKSLHTTVQVIVSTIPERPATTGGSVTEAL